MILISSIKYIEINSNLKNNIEGLQLNVKLMRTKEEET